MGQKRNPDDPKNLITDAYQIDGISDAECRSIFLDWALSLPEGIEQKKALARLLAAAPIDDHPMTPILQSALHDVAAVPQRRGGRAARFKTN